MAITGGESRVKKYNYFSLVQKGEAREFDFLSWEISNLIKTATLDTMIFNPHGGAAQGKPERTWDSGLKRRKCWQNDVSGQHTPNTSPVQSCLRSFAVWGFFLLTP